MLRTKDNVRNISTISGILIFIFTGFCYWLILIFLNLEPSISTHAIIISVLIVIAIGFGDCVYQSTINKNK